LARLCCGLWALFIAVGSFLPQGSASARVIVLGGHDKVGHAAAYAILTVLAIWALQGYPFLRRGGVAVSGAVVFGTLVECAQHFVGRSFSVGDLIANASGIALAAALTAALTFWLRKAPFW